MMGQGLTKARDGLTQVIKDIQEIKHTKFTGKKGSPNSVVSQTDMAKGAKSGINDLDLAKKGEELVADDNYQRYLDSIDPKNKTIGKRSAEALEDIKETLLGRDASTVDDVTFYGEFLDRDVKLNKKWTKMSEVDRWAVQNIDVQNAVMKSLLMQLRDLSATSSEMIGKTDIFATDGPMKNVADNLVTGLHLSLIHI